MKILKSHIGNDREYEFVLHIGLALDMCGLGTLIQLIIIFYYFIFESVSLYIAVISETVFQFEVEYNFIIPHS